MSSFSKTIAQFGVLDGSLATDFSLLPNDLQECLRSELGSYISTMHAEQLTRCGGKVSDTQLVDVLSLKNEPSSFTVVCKIQFTDGDPLDCSGHCGGTRNVVIDQLNVIISRSTGRAEWATTDGVFRGT